MLIRCRLTRMNIWIGCVTCILLTACGSAQPPPAAPVQAAQAGNASLKLTSPAFAEGSTIPEKYTCDGQDASPPLTWSDLPKGTKSLVLISDDPDAPGGTWVHWVFFNLPPSSGGLAEAMSPDKNPARGSIQGTNSWSKIGYGGPCPPSGTHRYFFSLYALDTLLNLTRGATARDIDASMKGHVLAEAQLMGRYQRTR
jgi:Raf kinase inhibitor-like YbhB/YbcL family protein